MVAMRGLFQCLKTTVVPYLVKTPRTHPRLMEHLNDENTSEDGPYRGTTKAPSDTGEGILSLLDILIHDETTNPRRRDNIQLVREFVEKHGWPEQGYVIWALKGVVLVLTERQWGALPQSPVRADAFELVRGYRLTSCFPRPSFEKLVFLTVPKIGWAWGVLVQRMGDTSAASAGGHC